MKRASSAAVAHHEPEEEPELVLAEVRHPAPLDHRIASVWLHTLSNNLNEGYDLLMSASFGKERVVLKGGGFELDGKFSLTSADIELEFVRCSPVLIDDGSRNTEAHTTIKDQATYRTLYGVGAASEVAGGDSMLSSAKAKLSGSYEKSGVVASTIQREVTRPDYYRVSANALKVGPMKVLGGPIVQEYKGWRVVPSQTNVHSGVIARLKVREDWIRFEDVRALSSPTRFVEKLRELVSGPDKKRREHFQLLLAHLAQTALSGHQDGRAATIAVGALVVRPFKDTAFSTPEGPSSGEIPIEGEALKKFLSSDTGREGSTLIALGVGAEAVSALSRTETGRKSKRGEFFIPYSTPLHVLAALEQIHKATTLPKGEMEYPHTLRDLRALKVVHCTKGGKLVGLAGDKFVPAGFMLRRAISEMECIRIARSVLTINPSANYQDIADAVAIDLGKEWVKQSTKRRKGNAIKRWAVWLEPHLLDPSVSGDAAARVVHATETRVVKGRPSTIMMMREPELRRMAELGVPRAAIAATFKVSVSTIRNWMRALGVERKPWSRGPKHLS
jgi:hypothetical protein